LIGLGTTGVLAVGTGVLGALALRSKSTFDSRVQQVGVTTQQVDDAQPNTRLRSRRTSAAASPSSPRSTIVLAPRRRARVIREGVLVVPGGLAGTF
jgi:hypothetical protein